MIGAAVAVVGLGAVGYWRCDPGYCRSAYKQYGFKADSCPDGKVRQVAGIAATGLTRGGEGSVTVSATAVFTTDKSDEAQRYPVNKFDVSLALIDGADKATPLTPVKKWEPQGANLRGKIELPTVRDGDYKLRATVTSLAGESSVDLPIPLYAPAKIHVLTDRPLYEAGQEVQFRALALRSNTLEPIDFRPGRWLVRDPSGVVLLEEKVAAGEWGVVSGSFPLDTEAQSGTWTVAWQSGGDSGASSFVVEPFTLPRFRVDVKADRSFYKAGDVPVVRGNVIYSSGAPVGGANVALRWGASGAWPPPPEWLEGELPTTVVTRPGGSFELRLPEVPADLRGRAYLSATVTAVDSTGDRVAGALSLLLSEDPIAVQAQTELAGGLVRGSNNRVYLRVTTADGQALAGAKVNVRRGWEPDDPGIDAELDADAVTRVQLDPGPPVNVVVPPMPVRRSQKADSQKIVRTQARDMVSGNDASLADRAAMDGWLSALGPCSKWVASGQGNANVAARVSASGQVVSAVAGGDPLSVCVADKVRGKRVRGGLARLYRLTWRFDSPKLPNLTANVTSSLSGQGDVAEIMRVAALGARSCIGNTAQQELPEAIAWQVRAGSPSVSTSWIRIRGGGATPAALKSCIQREIASLVARRGPDQAFAGNDLGIARFTVTWPAAARGPRKPQPTIMKGYELTVSALLPDGKVGKTTLRMKPGATPRLRVRATPVLPKPGDKVEVKFIRGPEFRGKLPKKLSVRHLSKTWEQDIDEEAKAATFELPKDAKGWYELSAGGVTSRVFVPDNEQLAVTVSADKARYKPGETANIAVQTTVGGAGKPAGVGLFGVDASLGQIAVLPGPDALAGLRPTAKMQGPAFGVLDAQALALGRIRGGFAAEATVLKVSQVPTPSEVDKVFTGSAEAHIDAIAELTDRFYPVLTEVHAQARLWEANAPKDQVMTPAVMAQLWSRSLEAVAKRGGDVTDAYGRRLRLHRLPPDLLALVEPRQVVVVGTRLPEDVENWGDWVAKEKP